MQGSRVVQAAAYAKMIANIAGMVSLPVK